MSFFILKKIIHKHMFVWYNVFRSDKMYAYIKGRIEEQTSNQIILENNNIEYIYS